MDILLTRDDLPYVPKPHKVEYILSNEAPPIELTSSAFVFAFQCENVMLAQVYSRGWDIPGGHIENGETPEQSVVRELFEETGSSLQFMGSLGYLKVTLLGDRPSTYPYPYPTSYLAFYWGSIETVGQPSASMEVGEPRLFSPNEARKQDQIKYNIELYEAALERAKVFAQMQ